MNIIIRFLRKIYNQVIYNDVLEKHIKRGLIVGKNFRMHNEVIIDPSCTWLIEIGDNVTLAPRVHILAHDASMKKHLDYGRIGKVKIGDKVFIGAGTIVLPGVTIGSNVVVGAGSIVTRDIPDGQVVAGNPAKIICSIEDFLKKKKKEMNDCPCFTAEYRSDKIVTPDMIREMNLKMKNNIGYMV